MQKDKITKNNDTSVSNRASDKLKKPYNPTETEKRIYSLWEKSGFFNPDNLPKGHKESFTIVMPPPNANGHLHAGHALVMTLEDIMIRYKRMCGYKTLWVPGADHAGFETQIVYEKQLEKEGRSRFKMNPKDLYDEIYKFTIKNKGHMEDEVRALGASCDWSRERFTLDPDIVKCVQETFLKMHKDGLIYRGKRPVNWCTKHQTSLSEVETMSSEKKDPLYYIKYGPFTLATVRPETKFGDTAIAVNPKDARYKKYVGKEIEIDHLIGKVKLKVIADDFVDPEFGTGVVKVTPAHDPNDFEMGLRHNLKIKEVIDKFGKLNEKTGKYAGLKIAEAREKVVHDLKEAGLLEKIDEDYTHTVKTCYKCETVIEPMVMDQWFVKMDDLSKRAKDAVDSGKIKFIPDNFRKIFNHWMENPIDWNISRQIVWGIQIPAKICTDCKEGVPDLEKKIIKCYACGGKMKEDTDTFDTWFSSGQWPLLVMDFPDGKDFKTFYPTDIMETGYDLVFKWIPRMVIFGLYLADKIPFGTVYLHGMVRDGKGQKMSKSKGNVINPLALTEKYGTDALRIGLVVGNTPGTDLSLSEERIRGYKHFANKIWNASRFVLENTEGIENIDESKILGDDKKILKELSRHVNDVTKDMNKHFYYLASEKIYHYFWHTFADKIIEDSKEIISGNTSEKIVSRKNLLRKILVTNLKLLHPFMPFITEEVWVIIDSSNTPLMISNWPK